MQQIIKRRRFFQLMFANAVATTVLGNLGKKSLASNKNSPQLIYGVRVTSGRVLLLSLDLATGQIQDLSASTPELNLLPNERLSGFTLLSDGTFVLATAPTTATITGQSASLSRLLSFSSPQTLPALQGLERNSTIESLLGTNERELLSIISLNQGSPPFRLATINLQTGQVSFINDLPLPPNRRFSNLAQRPDGHIYATSIARESSTGLVQLELQLGNLINLSPLSFNNQFVLNDLASLTYSPANQLFALADPTSKGTNSVFRVDETTGVMEMPTDFEVDKIVFARLKGKRMGHYK